LPGGAGAAFAPGYSVLERARRLVAELSQGSVFDGDPVASRIRLGSTRESQSFPCPLAAAPGVLLARGRAMKWIELTEMVLVTWVVGATLAVLLTRSTMLWNSRALPALVRRDQGLDRTARRKG
jgi:hypothetical protein